MTERIDYDAVAELYDAQPYRAKTADQELIKYLEGRDPGTVRVLDVACGTGNQIVANHLAFPDLELVGVDASRGMLEVARRKSDAVTWVQAQSDALPFEDGSFDFVTCQFAYHHFPDSAASFAEAFRVLRAGGRFVLTNASPHDYRDSAFYGLFPTALELDLQHFWSADAVRRALEDCGFHVECSARDVKEAETWGELVGYVGVRTNNSHLTAMRDADYEAGMERAREEVARRGADAPVHNPVVIATFRADKP